jgi:hypothetical protein
MYEINYYVHNQRKILPMQFSTITGAAYFANNFYLNRNIQTEVVDLNTGEVMAAFTYDGCYISPTLEEAQHTDTFIEE